MSSTLLTLSAVETFRGLSGADLTELEARLAPVAVARGTALVREGEEAEALYVVVAGRFSVEVAGTREPVAEISAGATIGEIAFFAGGARTATVTAIRDSIVVCLSRADFDEITARAPGIWSNITATLAARLAAETRKSASLAGVPRPTPRARTIALVHAGARPLPDDFAPAFARMAQQRGKTLVVGAEDVTRHIPCGALDTLEASRTLNELEADHDTILYITDPTLTPWSEKAIRQADEILLAGYQDDTPVGAPVPLNALEAFSHGLEHPPRHRLALLHPRKGGVQGTRHWLANRSVEMHHHLARGSSDDLARLWRFLRGEARGLVACGGGAYCAAHIGIYRALCERGIAIDIVGGTSGGAAMAAAFAEGIGADEIEAGIHRMFIEGKAMQRYTLPRYSLLDHTHFDRHLVALYGQTRIEDLWTPYFAVALDLSANEIEVIRSGPVWAAIRASAAIPALLPPYFTDDGRVLVDGSVAANVPADVMRAIKPGPNIVITFDPPMGARSRVDYDALPGRRELAAKLLTPWGRKDLPDAPSAGTILVRSLMANRNHFERHVKEDDWLLMPPTPPGMGALDWRRHSELADAAYRYTLDEIKRRDAG